MNCCLSLKALLSPQRQKSKTLNFVHVVGSINIDQEEMIDLGVNSDRVIASEKELTAPQTMVLDTNEQSDDDHPNNNKNEDDDEKRNNKDDDEKRDGDPNDDDDDDDDDAT